MTMFSVAILCGGRSTRMGQDKAEMKLQAGGPRMVDRLLAAFSDCDEVILSLRDEAQLPDLDEISDSQEWSRLGEIEHEQAATLSRISRAQGKQPAGRPGRFVRVTDPVSGAGPLAGIVASLRASRHELVFVTAVDMPYMDRAFAEELLSAACKAAEEMMENWDVLLLVDPDGRPHPLGAFYKNSALPVLEEGLKAGTYSLWRNFQKLRVCRVPAETLEDSARKLMNLNRPEDVNQNSSRFGIVSHEGCPRSSMKSEGNVPTT